MGVKGVRSMATKMVSFRMDEELWEEVRRVAEARGESQADVLDRVLRNALPAEKAFIRHLANPVVREVILRLAAEPVFLSGLAKLVGDRMSSDQVRAMSKEAARLRGVGRERAGKGKSRRGGLAGGVA
jgi:hypothetical protein